MSGSVQTGGRPAGRPLPSRIDWQALHITEVWRALGGPSLTIRNGRARTKAFWRDGHGLNVSIDVTHNVWHDHVTGDGGRCLELAIAALGGKQQALRFLTETFPSDGAYTPPTGEDRRAAEYARLWRAGRIRELERIKAGALFALDEPADDPEDRWARWCVWTTASRELYATEQLAGANLARRFEQAAQESPREVALLIDDQVQHERNADEVAAFLVGCLAISTDAGVQHAA
ncbi:MAG: hypothetical protein JNL98_21275 [Bryobacterales bacterium]|nr:hypothetical protein [Bryobacterales bacterium]